MFARIELPSILQSRAIRLRGQKFSSEKYLSSMYMRSWLISCGSEEEVSFWRTEVATEHVEPLTIVDRLYESSTCIKFSPRERVTHSDFVLNLSE